MTSALTQAEADEILASMEGFGSAPLCSVDELIEEVHSLTVQDLERGRDRLESGEPKYSNFHAEQTPLKAMRQSHHRVAQLLAVGTDETTVARICNLNNSYISILKTDPAFKELLAHYSDHAAEEWADFIGTARDLSMDFLQELSTRLNDKPESFTIGQINEVIKTLADRSGNAPVSKSVSVSVTANMGDKLAFARERANALLIEQQSRPPT